MLDLAEHIQTEELAFVSDVVTQDIRFGDLSAFDQASDAEQLAETALHIDLVTLIGNEIHVAFTVVKHVQELRNINAV